MLNVKGHTSLSSTLFDAIKEQILNGTYPAGEALTETKLSTQFGVSRTPIREALHRLQTEGFVTITPNKSAVVSAFSPQDIEDMYEIRLKLEGLAAKRAAQNITSSQLDSLKESIDLLEFYITKGNNGKMGDSDSMFHEIIYHASGSRPLQNVLAPLHTYIMGTRRRAFAIEGRQSCVLAEHRAIYEAIAARDADLAQQRAFEHIKNATQIYYQLRGDEFDLQ